MFDSSITREEWKAVVTMELSYNQLAIQSFNFAVSLVGREFATCLLQIVSKHSFLSFSKLN